MLSIYSVCRLQIVDTSVQGEVLWLLNSDDTGMSTSIVLAQLYRTIRY